MISCGRMNWSGRNLRTARCLTRPSKLDSNLLLTCDQNVRYQQNFAGRKVALVILSANRWPTLRRTAARIASAVDSEQTGQIVRVDVALL